MQNFKENQMPQEQLSRLRAGESKRGERKKGATYTKSLYE